MVGPLSSMEREFLEHSAAKGLRLDSRGPSDMRTLQLSFGVASGTVHASLGESRVLVQVSGELLAPYKDRPTEGLVIFKVTLPSGDDDIDLTAALERNVRECEAVDLETLCVVAGDRVWHIKVAVRVLQDQGNLLDVSSIGALAALQHFRRPCVTEGVSESHHMLPLSVLRLPISISFAVLANRVLLVDPTRHEEMVAGAILTLTLAATVSGAVELCGIHKPGGTAVSLEDLGECMNLAVAKARALSTSMTRAVEQDHADKLETLLQERGALRGSNNPVLGQPVYIPKPQEVHPQVMDMDTAPGTPPPRPSPKRVPVPPKVVVEHVQEHDQQHQEPTAQEPRVTKVPRVTKGTGPLHLDQAVKKRRTQ